MLVFPIFSIYFTTGTVIKFYLLIWPNLLRKTYSFSCDQQPLLNRARPAIVGIVVYLCEVLMTHVFEANKVSRSKL